MAEAGQPSCDHLIRAGFADEIEQGHRWCRAATPTMIFVGESTRRPRADREEKRVTHGCDMRNEEQFVAGNLHQKGRPEG